MTPSERLDALLSDLQREFPEFAILPKRGSRLQGAIHVLLAVLTLGGQRVYLTHYHTVLFGKLWVPDSWATMADVDKYILLRHERVHLQQRRRMGDVKMAIAYLLVWFPIGLAYGRAKIEWEAYIETIRATAELRGLDAAEALRPLILRRFTGGEYGWMWPFPTVVGRWFDDVMGELRLSSPARRMIDRSVDP